MSFSHSLVMVLTVAAAAAMAAVPLAACSKSDAKSLPAEAVDAPAFRIGGLDANAANMLVPTALKGTLTFSKQTITTRHADRDASYTIVAPVGWPQTNPEWTTLDSNGSMFKFGHDCGGGVCKPKDWAKAAEREYFQLYPGETVLSDVKGDHQRAWVVKTATGVTVTTAWWRDGDSHFYYCTANLSRDLVDAAPAFAQACSALTASE